MDHDSAIIEIRGATGGDEAKLWADDLFRMYWRFAEKNGWVVKLIDNGVMRVKGREAYQLLKHEAGVHRVQRIPTTERHGRIHTSTATVAVLPVIAESQIQINPTELEWQFYRASSQGGQNVQKVSTAVRLIHKPTHITVTCERERFQEQNRRLALDLLRTKLWEEQESKKKSQIDATRRQAVGQGARSEKIRTYNYPQNRVTDHRLGKSWHNLEAIIDGHLEKIVHRFT